MVPRAIVEQLARVRRRERAVCLSSGAARWVVLAGAAMGIACLVDWLIDLRYETPGALRSLMLLLQAGLWIVAGIILLVRPALRPRSDRDVALWVEETFPEFGHRLITAVELNRPDAPIEGMSAELIAAVTREAEEMSGRVNFARRVDWSPLRKGLCVLAPAVAVAAIVGLSSPETSSALLARQFMADREIPRSVRLESERARRVWPTGEEIQLRFRAAARVPLESLVGEVRIDPSGRPSESYPLAFESKGASGRAAFVATIPGAGANFEYRAWLRDGRTRKPAEVVYEPRPVVQKIDAWVLLPKYCGLRPDGTPYEQYRPRGEIAGPLGSSARVAIQVQKPVVRAALELLGRPGGETSPEALLRKVDLALEKGGRTAAGTFDLRPGETAYRVVVEDRYAFLNSAPPRREVAIMPDEPPRVVLLPERFAMPGDLGLSDESEVEGMPIPLGSAVRIAFYCAHPFGLDRARLAYRVIKGGRTSEETPAAAPELPWQYLPLGEVRQTAESGVFDLRRGCFQNTGFRDQVEFHPLPSPDPERMIGRTEGGGCFDFQTRALPDLKVGDQIELCVEVFARNPALEKTPGRSEVRAKAFVTQPQFVEWVLQTLKHEARIRRLEARQRGVFTPEGTDR